MQYHNPGFYRLVTMLSTKMSGLGSNVDVIVTCLVITVHRHLRCKWLSLHCGRQSASHPQTLLAPAADLANQLST